MRTSNKIRTVLAWVMLMSLMPFIVVKAAHFHNHYHIECNDDNATHIDEYEGACPICSFVMSPAVESAEPEIESIDLPFEYVEIRNIDFISATLNINYGLRAPPISQF